MEQQVVHIQPTGQTRMTTHSLPLGPYTATRSTSMSIYTQQVNKQTNIQPTGQGVCPYTVARGVRAYATFVLCVV